MQNICTSVFLAYSAPLEHMQLHTNYWPILSDYCAILGQFIANSLLQGGLLLTFPWFDPNLYQSRLEIIVYLIMYLSRKCRKIYRKRGSVFRSQLQSSKGYCSIARVAWLVQRKLGRSKDHFWSSPDYLYFSRSKSQEVSGMGRRMGRGSWSPCEVRHSPKPLPSPPKKPPGRQQ